MRVAQTRTPAVHLRVKQSEVEGTAARRHTELDCVGRFEVFFRFDCTSSAPATSNHRPQSPTFCIGSLASLSQLSEMAATKAEHQASKTPGGREAIGSDSARLAQYGACIAAATADLRAARPRPVSFCGDDESDMMSSTQAPSPLQALKRDDAAVNDWTRTFWTLRNACVECRGAQAGVRAAGLLEVALGFALEVVHFADAVDGAGLEAERRWQLLHRALHGSLQFLVNAVTGCPPSQGAVWRVLCGGRECDRSSDAGEDEVPAPTRTGRTNDRVLDLLLGCGRLGRGAGGDRRRQCLACAVALLHNSVTEGSSDGGDGEGAAGAELGDADGDHRLRSLAADKALVSVLLRLAQADLASAAASQAPGVASGGTVGGAEEEDEAGEWVVLLVGRAVRARLVRELWEACGAGVAAAGTGGGDGAEDSVCVLVTPEQLVLLSIVAVVVADWSHRGISRGIDRGVERGAAGRGGEGAVAAGRGCALTAACVALVAILRAFPPEQRLSDFAGPDGGSGGSSEHSVAATAAMHYHLNEEGRSIILEVLAEAALTDGGLAGGLDDGGMGGEGGTDGEGGNGAAGGGAASNEGSSDSTGTGRSLLRPALVRAGLVDELVRLMTAATPASTRAPVRARTPPSSTDSAKPPPPAAAAAAAASPATAWPGAWRLPPEGRRVSLVRLAANLAHKCPEAQEAFHGAPPSDAAHADATAGTAAGPGPLVKHAGLVAVLNQCNLDKLDGRPGSAHLREWGIFAVRNLCDGHARNRAAIDALTPQAIDPSSLVDDDGGSGGHAAAAVGGGGGGLSSGFAALGVAPTLERDPVTGRPAVRLRPVTETDAGP